MQELTQEGRQAVEAVAQRHGVSGDAAATLLRALVAGHGTMAQFSHPELGGMGQWSLGGMIMVGDMFDHGLKARVDALCTELAALLGRGSAPLTTTGFSAQSQSQSGGASGHASPASLFVSGGTGSWWPPELGAPATAGGQNDLRYAVFPASRRLALDKAGEVTLYDTGDHVISGVSQQQSGDRTLTFTSQRGLVRLTDLPVVGPAAGAPRSAPAPASQPPSPPPSAAPHQCRPRPSASEDVLATLERLAELRRKDILSEEEFAAKKTELLARL